MAGLLQLARSSSEREDSEEELIADGAAPIARPDPKRALAAGLLCLGLCAGAALVAGGRAGPVGRAAASEAVFLATLPVAASTCSDETDDCSVTKCCATPGFQCYRKDAKYAGCKGFCIPGNGSDWACDEIGVRAPMPSNGVAKCSWAGESCSAGTHCCNDANMKCYTKDQYFASCHFNPQDGWDNKEIGLFRGWDQITPGAAKGLEAGTSLYCLTVQSPPQPKSENRAATDDGALLAAVQSQGLGIYACDEFDVFQGGVAQKAEWQSISNTDIFIQVWDQVFKAGKFWHHDWTVKVDPDAVFFPDRLRSHLVKLAPPKGEMIYIKNTDFKFGFMGSLEIFSEKAMEEFHTNGHLCTEHIGHTGGEDFYIMTCMDALGVGSMQDVEVLDDKYTSSAYLDLKDVSPCKNGWTAAFHPYKDWAAWGACHTAATDTANAWLAAHAPAAPGAPGAAAPAAPAAVVA